MHELTLIGAGVSALAAASCLRPFRPLVFEKSRGFGGRAATRELAGLRFDHGANYFHLEDSQVAHLVKDLLPEPPVAFDGPIHVFDQHGPIRPGDPEKDQADKWTYANGISCLGKQLATFSGVDIRHSCRVARLQRIPDGWRLFDEEGHALADSRRVLISLPAEQAADLFEETELSTPLQACHYHRQWALMLAFNQRVGPQRDFYAALNTDRRHPIAWLSFEDDKPGRVPANRSGLVLQLNPEWSAENFLTPADEVLSFALEEARKLLDFPLPEAQAYHAQRWKFAHPKKALSPAFIDFAEQQGLYLMGDALLGKGRVEGALATGLKTGTRLSRALAGMA